VLVSPEIIDTHAITPETEVVATDYGGAESGAGAPIRKANRMLGKARLIAAVTTVAVVLASVASPHAAVAAPRPVAYTYSTYRYPGATEVQISGDNSHGVLVGTEGSIRNMRAFYLVGGHYHLLTVPYVPGGSTAFVAGITNGGEIVGSYSGKNGRMSGWIRSAKTHHYTRFALPGSEVQGSLGTVPESVSPGGVISGLYYTYDSKTKDPVEHGFYGQPGAFKTFTIRRTVPQGLISGSGLFFYRSGVFGGDYNQGAGTRAFYVADGALHTVLDPYDNNQQKQLDTYLVGMDRRGVLYGYSFSFAKGYLSHGNSFGDADGVFDRIADPKAAAPVKGHTSFGTSIDGVTAAGVLYGSYATNDRGGLAGFVAVLR
jgi:hypothetical protein